MVIPVAARYFELSEGWWKYLLLGFFVWLLGLQCRLRIEPSGITFQKRWYFIRTKQIIFPLDTRFEIYEAWEDEYPSGVSFDVPNVGYLHLGTSKDYASLYQTFGEVIEECKTLAGRPRT